MLTASQFKLATLQTVIYTPDPARFSPSETLRILLGHFPERYDGSPQALPLGDDVPAELPRIMLQSQDKAWQLTAGPVRMDSYLHVLGELEVDYEEAVRRCAEVLVRYVQEVGVQVNRLALVVTRVLQTNHPSDALIEHFCNDQRRSTALNRSDNFEIHNHKLYSLDGKIPINSWVRCKSARLKETDDPIVAVDQDLNTVPESLNPDKLSSDFIESFFVRVAREADDILHLYFPEAS